jgi:hypothetical protein
MMRCEFSLKNTLKYRHSVPASQEARSVYFIVNNLLMESRQTVSLRSENRMEQINALCGQNKQLLLYCGMAGGE